MSRTQRTNDVSVEQAESYHTIAITSEAIPVAYEFIEAAQSLAVQAESDRDGDLKELSEELRQASEQLRELADTAHYLADRP